MTSPPDDVTGRASIVSRSSAPHSWRRGAQRLGDLVLETHLLLETGDRRDLLRRRPAGEPLSDGLVRQSLRLRADCMGYVRVGERSGSSLRRGRSSDKSGALARERRQR
jgi:hypothetical protein